MSVFSFMYLLEWIIRSAQRLRPGSQTNTSVIGPGVRLSCHYERVHHLGCNDTAREPLWFDWRLKIYSKIYFRVVFEGRQAQWGRLGAAFCPILFQIHAFDDDCCLWFNKLQIILLFLLQQWPHNKQMRILFMLPSDVRKWSVCWKGRRAAARHCRAENGWNVTRHIAVGPEDCGFDSPAQKILSQMSKSPSTPPLTLSK